MKTAYTLQKHYPIEGRTDFFKYVIQTPKGLAKDFKGEVMYFDEFNKGQAERVLEAIKKTSKTEKRDRQQRQLNRLFAIVALTLIWLMVMGMLMR